MPFNLPVSFSREHHHRPICTVRMSKNNVSCQKLYIHTLTSFLFLAGFFSPSNFFFPFKSFSRFSPSGSFSAFFYLTHFLNFLHLISLLIAFAYKYNPCTFLNKFNTYVVNYSFFQQQKNAAVGLLANGIKAI